MARDALFAGVASPFMALQWHSYSFSLPPGAQALAGRPDGLHAFRCGPAAWGVQFHPEVSAATADLWVGEAEELLERQRPGWAAELRGSERGLHTRLPGSLSPAAGELPARGGHRDVLIRGLRAGSRP